MAVQGIARDFLLSALCLWVIFANPASGSQIVGVTFSRGLYDIDSLRGNATLLSTPCPGGCGPYFGASSSPDANSIYIQSVVNIWEVNLNGPQFTPFGAYSTVDLAFDRARNTIYATDGSALFAVACPSPSSPDDCRGTQVGPGFPTNTMQALDFVPGVGLYGAGDNNLYLIDPSTGVATLLGFTGILPDPAGTTNVTDLAYDRSTGRLIASVGCLKMSGSRPVPSALCNESNGGSIYSIDRFTGEAILLNGNAPQIMGLAEVVPEPGSGLPVVASLGALLVWNYRAKFRPPRSPR